jgi:hypothetical protein
MIRTQYNGAINARVAAQITARISLLNRKTRGIGRKSNTTACTRRNCRKPASPTLCKKSQKIRIAL